MRSNTSGLRVAHSGDFAEKVRQLNRLTASPLAEEEKEAPGEKQAANRS